MRFLRPLILLALISMGAIALLLVAAGFVEGTLLLAHILGLSHALGMDTQTSHNYAAVSGSLPMFVAVFGFSSFFAAAWRHVNCEQPGCLRPGHRHPNHGRPVCRKHYHSDAVSRL